jgi:hypothetical protein
MKCHGCDAEVPDSKDETLAAARWGWMWGNDPAMVDGAGNFIPSAYYACPDCSEVDMRDAWARVRAQTKG